METQCCVCFEIYQKEGDKCPKRLPCLHTLCLRCLKTLTTNGQAQCPECCSYHQVPQDGVQNYPTNKKILEEMDNLAATYDDLKTLSWQQGNKGIYTQTAHGNMCEIHGQPFITFSNQTQQLLCEACLLSGESMRQFRENRAISEIQNFVHGTPSLARSGITAIEGNGTRRDVVLLPYGLGLPQHKLDSNEEKTIQINQIMIHPVGKTTNIFRDKNIHLKPATDELNDNVAHHLCVFVSSLLFVICFPLILAVAIILMTGAIVAFSVALACAGVYFLVTKRPHGEVSKMWMDRLESLFFGYGRFLERCFYCSEDDQDGWIVSDVCPGVKNFVLIVTVFIAATMVGVVVCVGFVVAFPYIVYRHCRSKQVEQTSGLAKTYGTM